MRQLFKPETFQMEITKQHETKDFLVVISIHSKSTQGHSYLSDTKELRTAIAEHVVKSNAELIQGVFNESPRKS